MNQPELFRNFLDPRNTSGRCGNVFYEGGKLYSYGYHYLMAQFIQDRILVINSTKSTPSTERQKHWLRQQASINRTVYATDCDVNNLHKDFEAKISELKKKVVKARENFTTYISRLKYLTANHIYDCNLLGFEPKIKSEEELFQQLAQDPKLRNRLIKERLKC